MKGPVLALALSWVCVGATTQTWEMGGYQDFLRGRINGLSLTSDGKLLLGPRMTTLFDSGQAEVWSAAQAPDGSLYLGTGNRGRLFRVDPSGQNALVWTAAEPEIFAVAVDPKGVVYAATSPDGKVYRIENGTAAEYFAPGARYIWALAVAPDGALMVATGDQGKIFRVTAPGQGSVYYETGQAHVTSLAFDAQGRLLAGSEPNGILYRVTAAGKAFALYDSSLPEIRAIVTTADGTVVRGGAGRRRGSPGKRSFLNKHFFRGRRDAHLQHQHYRDRSAERHQSYAQAGSSQAHNNRGGTSAGDCNHSFHRLQRRREIGALQDLP